MKKIIKLSIISLLFALLPFTIYADCESDFKAVEQDFKVSYKYNADSDDFTITLVSPDYQKYVFYYDVRGLSANTEDKIINQTLTKTISHYKKTEFEYGIVASYEGCSGKMLKKITTRLSKTTNPYAGNKLCEGNEDFVLCQSDYDKELDEETFNERIEAYIKSKEKDETGNINNEEDISSKNKDQESSLTTIVKYVEEHITIVIIAAVALITLVIVIIIIAKKSIESRRLE